MAITNFYQLKQGGKRTRYGVNPGETHRYIAISDGGDDQDDAYAHAIANTDATIGALTRQNLEVEDGEANNTFIVDVEYGWPNYQAPDPPATGNSSFSFEIGTETANIKISPNTISGDAPDARPVPETKGYINITEDGVDGVDVLVPTYRFSETHYKAVADVDAEYKGAVFALISKTNDASFKGFAAGEVIFLGARGAKRGADDWEITYEFAAAPNATSIAVGDITVAAKKGWEYLWTMNEPADDQDAGVLSREPIAAFVEELYPPGDFSALEIGTT